MLLRLFSWVIFLPLQLGIATLFLVTEILRILSLPLRQGTSRQAPSLRRDNLCSIIVLNWDGRHLLEESLPPLLRAVDKTGQPHEILVVDNGSTDSSIDWLAQRFPTVRVLALDRNYGFGEGNNRGVLDARHDIVVLLNNDMIVEENFLTPLLEPFSDQSVFAVSSQVVFPAGRRREETGNTGASFSWGYLHLSHQPIQEHHTTRRFLPVLWAGGGSSAFDRTRFLALGGFSKIFSPCYFEDTDLSYRAWRRGWKVLLAAESRVLHKHRSTSASRFDSAQLQHLIEQRRLWYLWKNYPLVSILSNLLWMPLHFRKRLSANDYFGSLRKLPEILVNRMIEPRHLYGHNVIWRWISHPLSYLDFFFPDRARLSGANRKHLRVLVVSAYLPHLGYHGGAGRVFHLLLRIALHHEVTLLSFVETPKEAEELGQVGPHCKRAEIVLRREYQPVSPFPYEPFEEFNSPQLRKKLEQILTEEDFDLVHFEWTQMAQFADLAPHSPKLLTEIEVNYAAHQSQVRYEADPVRRLKKFYNTLQTMYRELEMCRRVDRVVTVTDVDKDFLRGYIPEEKLCVVNTGVDTQYFSPASEEEIEPNSIVFVGAFRHGPNVDAMLFFCEQVFPRILAEVPTATLSVVGSSPPGQILKLADHPNIRVTGFVPDIRSCYARAQLVVVPIRTGVGIRGKILEAWSSGRATIATPVACLGIRAAHGENIMLAEDPAHFALWTVALLRNPDHCRRIGRAGRKTAEQFYDWSLLGNQLSSLYQSLVQGDRSPMTTVAEREGVRR